MDNMNMILWNKLKEPINFKLPPGSFCIAQGKNKEKLRKSSKKSGIRFQTLFSFILILSI